MAKGSISPAPFVLPGDLEQQSMRVILQACAAVLIWGCFGAAAAQAPAQPVPRETTVERQVRALANRDTQIGLYLNVLPDCTSGPLPTIRLVTAPAAGKVVVKSAKAKATNYKACLALEVPAYVAFYKAPPEFLGDDALTIEVKYQGGRTEIQKITVKVSVPGGQQKI
ncbi:hypothetical protein RX327_15625 [Bradyrhizobium sp. BEA-2-5]|uniref:hypothetical protein n=1 Tax=Bradyrhizobium TaxID=374 RepID=UPI001FCD51C5|nr:MULTISPECIES: hypothetical protein [Bradyrhizobium]WOH84454.1 hypothetical protein RX327_15625 [Bradyrhizobium sp. BEA-2-5]